MAVNSDNIQYYYCFKWRKNEEKTLRAKLTILSNYTGAGGGGGGGSYSVKTVRVTWNKGNNHEIF